MLIISLRHQFSALFMFVMFALFFPASGTHAALLVHAHDSAGNLYTVDVETGQASLIGNTGRVFTDIAFDSSGRLFGISDQGSLFTNMGLYEINPTNATTSKIGNIGVGGFVNALVFDETGILWAASDASIITIDPLTGAGVLFADTLGGYGSAGDLALDTSHTMYLTTDNGYLISIDRNDGTVTEIGMLPQTNVFGFARGDDGNMYGLTSDNHLLLIDPQSGAGTDLGPIDAAFNIASTYGTSFTNETIPEPATLLLLFAGGLFLWRKNA